MIPGGLGTSDLTVSFTLQCVSLCQTDEFSVFLVYVVFDRANAKALSVVSALVFCTAYLLVVGLLSLFLCG